MSIIRDDEPPLFKTTDKNYTKRKIEENYRNKAEL